MMPRTENLPTRIVEAAPRALVGESPAWDEATGLLWWVDVRAPALHRTDPARGSTTTWTLPEPVGSLGLCRSGAVLLALKSGIHRFDPRDGALDLLAAPERDRPMNRLNDGKVSPEGRFLVGSMDDRPEKGTTGALWRLDPGSADCALLADGLLVSNGLAWSPDGRTLWHSDSRASVIWTWAYDPETGRVRNRREVARPAATIGRPDGAAVDVEGGYWSAGVSAGRLNRWLPDGTLDRVVELPVTAPTMPCFGGADRRTLYVTSLRPANGSTGTLDGTMLTIDVGIGGVPVGRFAD
jgi:sugar lactone lactonase YvrE